MESYYIAVISLFIFVLMPLGGFMYCSIKPITQADQSDIGKDA